MLLFVCPAVVGGGCFVEDAGVERDPVLAHIAVDKFCFNIEEETIRVELIFAHNIWRRNPIWRPRA